MKLLCSTTRAQQTVVFFAVEFTRTESYIFQSRIDSRLLPLGQPTTLLLLVFDSLLGKEIA